MLDEMMKKLEDAMQALQREADELKVQAALGKAEAKDRWEEVNGRLADLRAKLEAARGPAGEVAQDIAAKARELGDEIRDGIGKLRDALK